MCHTRNGNYTSDTWFSRGLNEFKDLDWDMEVDRFHLNNEILMKELTEFVKGI